MTTSGDLYTFGSKENGKLGHGRDTPSGSIGHVTQITRFLDSDEQTEWEEVKIGHVSGEGVYCVSGEGGYCVSGEGVYCVSGEGGYCVW